MFIVMFTVNEGPYPPSTSITYHRTREEASKEFLELQLEFSDDPCSLSMIQVDLETMTGTTLEFLEGTEEDIFGLGEEGE